MRVKNPYIFEAPARSPILEWMGCALLAFSLSYLLSSLNLLLLGRNVIEPFFIVGLALIFVSDPLLARTCYQIIRRPLFVGGFFFIVAMAIMGLITGVNLVSAKECIVAIYGDVRTNLILLFFICMALEKTLPLLGIDRVFIRVFTCLTCFECVSLFIFRDVMDFEGLFRFPVLPGAAFFLAIRALLTERPIYALLSGGGAALITVLAVMRYNYIILFLMILVMAFSFFWWTFVRRKVLRALILAVPWALSLIYLPSVVIQYYEDDINRTIHGIYRMQELFGEREGDYYDTARSYSNKIIFEEASEFIVPQGLGGKIQSVRIQSMFSNYGILSSLDSGVFFCIYHFGLFAGGGIVLWLFLYMLRQLWLAIKTRDAPIIVMSLSFTIIFVSLFLLKGIMFIFPQYAFFYGSLILWISRPEEFSVLYNAIKNDDVPPARHLPNFQSPPPDLRRNHLCRTGVTRV